MAQHYLYFAPVRGIRSPKKYSRRKKVIRVKRKERGPDRHSRIIVRLAPSADGFERKVREEGFRVIGQIKLVFPDYGEGASKHVEVMCDHVPLEKGLSESYTREHRSHFKRKRTCVRKEK